MTSIRAGFFILGLCFGGAAFAESSETIELSRCYQESTVAQDGLVVNFMGMGRYHGSYKYLYHAKIKSLYIRYDAMGNVALKQEINEIKNLAENFATSNAEFCLGNDSGTDGPSCKAQLFNTLLPRIRLDIASREHFSCD